MLVLATVTCLPLLANQQELHAQRPLRDDALIKYASLSQLFCQLAKHEQACRKGFALTNNAQCCGASLKNSRGPGG